MSTAVHHDTVAPSWAAAWADNFHWNAVGDGRLADWIIRLCHAAEQLRATVTPTTEHFAKLWTDFNKYEAAISTHDRKLLWFGVAAERAIKWSLLLADTDPGREFGWAAYDVGKAVCEHFQIEGVEWIKSPESPLGAPARMIDALMQAATVADTALVHP